MESGSVVLTATPVLILDTVNYTYGSSTSWGDLLTNYDGKAINYDTIGNPLKWHNTSSMDWEGRTLKKHGLLSNPDAEIEYSYNSDGIRISKYHKDVSNGNNYRHSYRLDGTKIVLEQYYHIHDGITETYYYLYDESGSVIGFQYNNKTYYYQKNIQGDVLHIIDESGNIVTTYTYSAFGEVLSVAGSLASTIGAKNPFRYRSYYYDVETGWYYLNSRYYDPKVGRFINADSLISTGQGILGNNMFAYCLNNPANYIDGDGTNAEALEWWTAGMGWMPFADTVLPIGDLIYFGGIAIIGLTGILANETPSISIDTSYSNHSSSVLKRSPDPDEPEPMEKPFPDVDYPGDDPTKSPGEDYEWKGKPPVGGDKGSWVNKNTGEQLHPDLNHKPPIGPHWDYKDIFKNWWRIFKDKITPKF